MKGMNLASLAKVVDELRAEFETVRRCVWDLRAAANNGATADAPAAAEANGLNRQAPVIGEPLLFVPMFTEDAITPRAAVVIGKSGQPGAFHLRVTGNPEFDYRLPEQWTEKNIPFVSCPDPASLPSTPFCCRASSWIDHKPDAEPS
jgi:hypothetical protein